MKTICKLTIIIYCLIFLSISYADPKESKYEDAIKFLQDELEKIQPQLLGNSVILIEDRRNKFSMFGKNTKGESQFYIGSLTKQFTSYMFIDLLHKKHPAEKIEKLLDKKLSEEFPDSVILNNLDRAWTKKITLLDLLTHRSGLSDYIKEYEFTIKRPECLNKFIPPKIILQSVHFDPRKYYYYSNTNYFILGKLVEEMQNASYDEYLIN